MLQRNTARNYKEAKDNHLEAWEQQCGIMNGIRAGVGASFRKQLVSKHTFRMKVDSKPYLVLQFPKEATS